ncbi:uroporphyrinogen-III synthase [Nonlabens dokdonensis]|jgi:uroporphyrinogen-III synthase|uniref:Uroporphyrinogen-III synthase n=2 Tax=Nonlabens dokdonensis TaxID=328515 RepID=A0ABX5Q3C7_9FLAO|nr:uroporphyrinogen-III synthase [Nonlabens dokdonensis]AGC76783.1 putative uroporphyrinogen-III synthase [Nonlabens dokdonensis DSW-6]PZX44428.1 uroporphyrinogen-III synthase [Nonlabens dokdonensis]
MINSILSTKLLTDSQTELILNSGLSITHFDILKIEPVSFEAHDDFTHVIITSKNAIPALLKYKIMQEHISCVGEKTAQLLNQHHIEPVAVADNASDLAKILINKYPQEKFLYLCGKQRRHQLPALFQAEKIAFKEHFVYRSIAIMKSFDRIFACVCFYSPRGVIAFAKANPKNKPLIAVCIGNTTADEARNYYDTIVIANKQTVENTLITAIKSVRNVEK